jgi:Flp pilus assembly CpaE family ATPase
MKQRVTRRAQRHPVHLEVKELNGQQVAGTFIVDISTLGARLESSTPLNLKDQVEFSFHQPNEDTLTRVTGVIVWVQPAAGKTDRYQMGVQFRESFLSHSSGTKTRRDDDKEAAGKTSLVSFLGSKGGVGNTFLTVNVAYLLAKEKLGKVLVVDLDLLYGQAIYFFDVKPKHTIIDIIENFEDLDSSYLQNLLHNHNDYLSLLPAPSGLEDAEAVTPVQVKKILHYLKDLEIFKWILIDCPHQMGEVALTAIESSDDIFLVTVPSLPALYNAKKLLTLLDLLGPGKSRISVILNSLQKEKRLSDAEVQKFLGREICCKIGFEPSHVDDSIDEGRPLGALAPKVAMSMGLKNVADRLIGTDTVRITDRWSRLKDMIKKS